MAVMPLFVAITPGMEVKFDEQYGGSGGGGPRREFDAAKDITYPAYNLS
jgi:hypothetical protein